MFDSIKIFYYSKLAQYRQSKIPVKKTETPKLVEVQSLNKYIRDTVMKKNQKFWLGNVLYLVKESKVSGWITLKAIGAKSANGDIVRGKLHVANQKRKKK
jgi:hypothetical protein